MVRRLEMAVAEVDKFITYRLIDSLTDGRGEIWYKFIRDACDGWTVNTEHRVAMFLAETLHESNQYRTLLENLKYSASGLRRTWPSRFNEEDAARMAYDEYAIAERAYGGRLGNGPEGSGDGFRYRGHGIIQITGKDNFLDMGKKIYPVDPQIFVNEPDLLAQPEWAAWAATAWWDSHGCNAAADDDDYMGASRIINLGNRYSTAEPVGWAQRLAMLQHVQTEMGL